VYRYDGANQIVSADAVAAIMEVKAVLNKSQLEEAFGKIEEVKRLKKRPISGMDQKATESTLTTTGTQSGADSILLGHVSVEATERYLGCKQRIRSAINDRIGIEPDPSADGRPL
jgi:hypothetical protein